MIRSWPRSHGCVRTPGSRSRSSPSTAGIRTRTRARWSSWPAPSEVTWGAYGAPRVPVPAQDSRSTTYTVPTVMLFVPSVDGISHSLGEFTKDEDLVSGLRHLTEVVRPLAAGALA